MSSATRREKAQFIRRLMRTEGAAVAENTQTFNEGRYASVDRLDDYEGLKAQARDIKEDAIERLPELLGRVRAEIEGRGGTVYVAADAAEANRYIASIAGRGQRLVKSKSMTSEELEVNQHLAAQGVDVIETDLGEWVLQLADEDPSHIVAPAIHKSREAIADLFRARFAPDVPLDSAEALTRFAREKLGELIREADIGMTGANFITADSGTLALVTSEGNARKTALIPPTYIAVAGVEKIIPTVEDLHPFVELIGRSGTGQDLTSYLSLFTPPLPSPTVDVDRPNAPMRSSEEGGAERSFHLVLVDNGRLAMREDPQLRETLYCIRCGACSNACANFQQVGGHAFGGSTYSGGIATGWEAGIYGLDNAASFNDLCTGCTRCVPSCPVNIDIPWINVVVRDRINRQSGGPLGSGVPEWLVDGLRPDPQAQEGGSYRQHFFAHFDRLARLGSAMAPLSNWVARQPPIRALLEWGLGIDRRRSLPAFRRETLRDWVEQRADAPSAADAPSVVLYADPYTNHVHVDRGKASVRALEALGLNVRVPAVSGTGRAPLSQGMIATAETRAHALWEALRDDVEAGHDIVVIEPTDLAMMRREYQKLLPAAAAEALQARSFDVAEYVHRHLDGRAASAMQDGKGQRVLYHGHCQQKTLGLDVEAVALLRRLGYEVRSTNVECCGMAGSFGYKQEYYELSMQVGKDLQRQLEANGCNPGRITPELQPTKRLSTSHSSSSEARPVLAASGTSCQEQMEALVGGPVVHPIQLVAPRM